MNKIERKTIFISLCFALIFGVTQNVAAMHIMEGYLPGTHALCWGVLCVPFVVMGFIRIKNIASQHRKAILLLAMVGAYAFVLSALKIPSVSGSSSHPTGTGLGAVLFGPSVMSVIGLIVLMFQALLLAHGGLTTLGANTFSMAIAGPFLSYGIFKLCKSLKVNKLVAVFLATAFGDLFTYIITSVQLALSHSVDATFLEALVEYLGVFAVTQVPLAIIEGIVSVVVIIGLEAYAKPELKEIGYMEE